MFKLIIILFLSLSTHAQIANVSQGGAIEASKFNEVIDQVNINSTQAEFTLKALNGVISSAGNQAVLSFNNLVAGQYYFVSCYLYNNRSNLGGDDYSLEHNGIDILTFAVSSRSAGEAAPMGASTIFQADPTGTATTLNFRVNVTVNELYGNGTTEFTHCVLKEEKNLIQSSKYN